MHVRIEHPRRAVVALLAALLLAATSFAVGARWAGDGAGTVAPGAGLPAFDVSSPEAAAMSLQAHLSAAADYYLKLDGIDGESQAAGHEDWIDIHSIQWGVSRPGGSNSGATRQRSSPSISDISVTKSMDTSSPGLAGHVTSGATIPTATVDVMAPFGQERPVPYLKITLSKVLVTSYQMSGAGDVPTESFSLNFARITMTYTEYASDGSKVADHTFSWDLEKGAPA